MAESPGRRDLDRWEQRLAGLATIIGVDALAVVLPVGADRQVVYAAHNLEGHAWLDGAIAQLVVATLDRKEPQRRSSLDVVLADGRRARAGLIAPAHSAGRLIGAVVALRLSDPFSQRDLAGAEALADLVGLELAVSNQLQRSERREIDLAEAVAAATIDRRHALVLYELSRAAGEEGPMRRLQRAVELLADLLECDTAAIFERTGSGLVLIAAHSYPSGAPRMMNLGDDDLLATVTKRRLAETRRLTPGSSRWAQGAEALAVPILTAGRVGAVIGLVRASEAFTPADLDLAPLIAERLGALAGEASPARVATNGDGPSSGLLLTTGAETERPRRPWPVVLLAIVLAATLAGTAALDLGGMLLYGLAIVVVLCAAWAATGSGTGAQMLLLVLLAIFVERASSPLLNAGSGIEQLAATGVGALIALLAAALGAIALRRARPA